FGVISRADANQKLVVHDVSVCPWGETFRRSSCRFKLLDRRIGSVILAGMIVGERNCASVMPKSRNYPCCIGQVIDRSFNILASGTIKEHWNSLLHAVREPGARSLLL